MRFMVYEYNIFLVFEGGVKTKEEAEADINAMMLLGSNIKGHKFWFCSVCNFSKKEKHLVFRHVDRLHYEFGISCDLCGKIFSTIYGALEHRRNIHVHK